MRRKVSLESLSQFMQKLAEAVRSPGKIYFTGGATALLLGFREQTIDIDLKMDPEPEGAFDAIAVLKNQLNVNVELAAPMISFLQRKSGANTAVTLPRLKEWTSIIMIFLCRHWQNWKEVTRKIWRMSGVWFAADT